MSNKARRMLVLLLIILKEAGPTAACSSSCSSRCYCSRRALSSVPQDLPTDITGLSLEGNAITALSQSDFSRYRSLTTLYLGSNQISTIHNKTFHSLTSLTILDLHSNHLTNLTAGIFVGLDNLRWLLFLNNNIHSIEVGTFNDTTKLRILDLRYNNISTITADTLGNLLHLQTLKLSHNNISTFPVQALSSLQSSALSELTLDDNQLETLPLMAYNILASISDVNIGNNPWQCDCRMASFKQRMKGSYPFENQIRCAGPANLTGQYLRDVTLNPEDLICEETTSVYSNSSTKHIVDSTDPPLAFQLTMTMAESNTGPADGGIVLSVPLLATLGVILGLLLICTIGIALSAVWYLYNWKKRDPTPLPGFSNTNPTGKSNVNEQIRLQAIQTNAGINSQSDTPHPDTEDSQHIDNLPTDEDPDTAEYETIDEVYQSESPHRVAGNRQSLDSFGNLVLPPSLPPQNQTNSGQMQQLASDDDYEFPSPFLYPGEGPQSHKHVNSPVAAAAKDAAAGPQDVVYEYENYEESVDNQSQTAAAPGADSPHHYEPLRNPSSQQHAYTSLVYSTSSETADG